MEKKTNIMEPPKTPTLKEYAIALAEFSPFIGDFVTVDKEAIRVFIGMPKYKDGKWISSLTGREIVTIYINGSYLNGIVDLEHYLVEGQIDYKRTRIEL